MKEEQNKLIKDLINNKFDIENFKNFTARVLNTTVRNRTVQDKIKKEYREYIDFYQVIGDYEDNDGKKIYIISVKTKDKTDNAKELDPTRAKTKQRNFIADLLRGNDKIPVHDGALVSFYNDISESWKLSFVKLDYSFTSKGIEEKVTPSKRASYIVGEGEGNKTVIKQFSSLIGNENEVSLAQLENLFQLEKVTNEFFDEYKKKYLDLKEHLEKDPEFIKEALKHTEKVEDFSEEFAKKLMGQLAFLYFLQKKGWLGVKLVPQKIDKNDYLKIYSGASSVGRELLDQAYKKISDTEYKLIKTKLEDKTFNSSAFADCFTKDPKFDEKWGSGEHKFIRTLFERHKELNIKAEAKGRPQKNFFNDYLEPLFYKALNYNRGDNQYFPLFNCKIPFLNGGLFEALDNYDWEGTNFHIRDEIFSNSKEAFEGDGILDVFDRFNFTINENEPSETEVAVDPEMLGKVFENLLDVKDRKSKGAFYTPREIVHYMCKESLINYLSNEIQEVEKNDFEQFLQMGEFTKEYDIHLFEMDYKKGKKINDEDWGMKISLQKNIEKIDKALANVKVADPAIGSGAFPLGMLTEIVKARSILTEYILIHEFFRLEKENNEGEIFDLDDKLRKKRSLYKLKLDTIENSLFGVDIEPSAVDIAKLRLWLSIVVDSPDDDIQPLPNLDFNLMVGNSLLDEFEGIKLFDEHLLENSDKIKLKMTQSNLFEAPQSMGETFLKERKLLLKEFFNPLNSYKKSEIKEEIENKEWELIKYTLIENGNIDKWKNIEKYRKQNKKPYFLWKLEFAEVFKEKGGFDIVIGNPPYVGEDGNKDIFRPISLGNLGRRFYIGKMDLFYFFFHLALDIGKNSSEISFITTNYFPTADGALKLRLDISNRSYVRSLINFNELKIFPSARGQHNIITLLTKNKETEILAQNINVTVKGEATHDLLNNVLYKNTNLSDVFFIEQDNIFEGEKKYIRISGKNMQTGTSLDSILNKLMNIETKLKQFCNINQGVVSGCDKIANSNIKLVSHTKEIQKNDGIYVLDLKNQRDLDVFNNIKTTDEYRYLRDFYKNSDIDKYISSETPTKKLIYVNTNYEKADTILYNHLLKFRPILENRLLTYNESYHWTTLHRAREEKIFVGEKLVVPYRSKTNMFSYNNVEWFCRSDVYVITKKESSNISLHYLLAVLNSKLYLLWLYFKGKRKGEILELFKSPLEEIPVKEISYDDQKVYINNVKKIIELKKLKENTISLENELDELIYNLYELSESEKEFVRIFPAGDNK